MKFRVYQVTDVGHVTGPARAFEAADVREALEQARGMIEGHAVELWQDDRYLVTLTQDPSVPVSDVVIVARDN